MAPFLLKLSLLKDKKYFIPVVIAASVSLIALVTGIVLLLNQNKQSTTTPAARIELADDTTAALNSQTQNYDITDNQPGFTLYAETGYPDSFQIVRINTVYNPEAKACKLGADEQCVPVSSTSGLVLPNHATIKMETGSYSNADDDSMSLSAYALLPDGSMVTMGNDPQFQYNFYDNETRVVQMSGYAYYRIKAQPEGKIFTVQIGDQIIKTTGGEFATAIAIDETTNKKDLQAINDLFMEVKSGAQISEEEQVRLRANNYHAGVFVLDGEVAIYPRGKSQVEATAALDSTNPYYMYGYKDYGTRTMYSVDDAALASGKTKFAKPYFTTQTMLSMNTYGIGNFDSTDVSQLYEVLLNHFDGVKAEAMTGYIKYEKEMAEFTAEWNNLMNKLSSCSDGWYKVAEGKCCPNGYTYNASNNNCSSIVYKTVTSTTLSCDSGYYLGSDNMCHKNGSGAPTATPYYTNNSGGGDTAFCAAQGSATYQLCKMALDIHSSNAYMSGSKCCLKSNVPQPELQEVK